MKGVLTALEASSLVMKLCLAGGGLLAVLGAYGVWHHEVYQTGVNDTIAAIAREDSKLISRALAARGKLKECRATGRDWDQVTGACK